MNVEIQGPWFCPSPAIPGGTDFYHFDVSGKVITFTSYEPSSEGEAAMLAIRYWFEPDTGTQFRLRLKGRNSWQPYSYRMDSGKLIIQDPEGHQWVLTRCAEADLPPWFAGRLALEQQKMDESE